MQVCMAGLMWLLVVVLGGNAVVVMLPLTRQSQGPSAQLIISRQSHAQPHLEL